LILVYCTYQNSGSYALILLFQVMLVLLLALLPVLLLVLLLVVLLLVLTTSPPLPVPGPRRLRAAGGAAHLDLPARQGAARPDHRGHRGEQHI